jgi:hypothetical protein
LFHNNPQPTNPNFLVYVPVATHRDKKDFGNMQFSFNFLSEETETGQQDLSQAIHPAHTSSFADSSDSSLEGMIKVIECPPFEAAILQRKTTTLPLQTLNGTTFNLLKVQEDSPENEYDLIPGKYEGIFISSPSIHTHNACKMPRYIHMGYNL